MSLRIALKVVALLFLGSLLLWGFVAMGPVG